MLLGLLAVAGPIWLHLYGAKRARRIPFAAVDFLLGTDRKVARHLRLREILLLAARILIFLIVPLLLAKPFVSCEGSGPALERGPQGAVLIIDNGFAASYKLGREELLARAKQRCRSVLDQLGPEAEVAILLTTETRGPEELSRDHLKLRDYIAQIEAVSMRSDTFAALNRASQLLAASGHARKSIILFTTHTSAAFNASEGGWTADPRPSLTVVDVTDGANLQNTSVASMSVSPDPEAGPRGLRISAELRNFGEQATGENEARLYIDGQTVARSRFEIPSRGVTSVNFSTSLDQGARTANVMVEIDDDSLGSDNRRHVVAHLRENVRVLLVNGDPRTVRYEDELFYVQTALRGQDSATSAQEVTADKLGDTDLGVVDVVVLANVAALAPPQVAALTTFVSSGGGLLIGVGSNVDPEKYNDTMRALLPQELASVLDAGYGSRGAELDVKALRLAKLDSEHPALKLFGSDGRGLTDARFSKIILLGPTTNLRSRKVLARYQSGAAAIVEGTVGQGRVLLFTSSLDRDWTDLAIQTGYLPLLDKSIRYLAKKQLRAGARDVLVGQNAWVTVEPSDRRIEIESHKGRVAVLGAERLKDRDRARFSETTEPGFFSVRAISDTGVRKLRPESAFAVNIDASLSDLSRLSADKLPQGGKGRATASEAHKRRVELWHGLGAALLLLLLLEGLIVLRQ